MWLSEDGRTHARWVPLESVPRVQALQSALSNLGSEERKGLRERFEEHFLSVLSEIGSTMSFSELESEFEAKAVPDVILEAVDWESIISFPSLQALSEIELRWRIDVLVILEDALIAGEDDDESE